MTALQKLLSHEGSPSAINSSIEAIYLLPSNGIDSNKVKVTSHLWVYTQITKAMARFYATMSHASLELTRDMLSSGEMEIVYAKPTGCTMISPALSMTCTPSTLLSSGPLPSKKWLDASESPRNIRGSWNGNGESENGPRLCLETNRFFFPVQKLAWPILDREEREGRASIPALVGQSWER